MPGVLPFEHRRQQLVLAREVIVERALRHRSRRRDLVHADAGIALPPEEDVGGIEDALPGGSRDRGTVASSMYTG